MAAHDEHGRVEIGGELEQPVDRVAEAHVHAQRLVKRGQLPGLRLLDRVGAHLRWHLAQQRVLVAEGVRLPPQAARVVGDVGHVELGVRALGRQVPGLPYREHGRFAEVGPHEDYVRPTRVYMGGHDTHRSQSIRQPCRPALE